MTDQEMVDMVKALVGDERFDAFAAPCLEMAKSAIVSRRFPYAEDATWEMVPEIHHTTAVQAAVYLVNRRGAEGETRHAESGTDRQYESAGIPDSYLRGIVPMVGVPK